MNATKPTTCTIDVIEVAIGDQRNLLELIRATGKDLPTFCYHSELSVFGACRLCLVEIDGRAVTASCSTAPQPGMVVKTDTAQLRASRKMTIELLLANHNRECPSCSRSNACSLQDIARRLGVDEVRFAQLQETEPVDTSSAAVTRDPNKCVLCGDCVRMCDEVQDVGALAITHRGSDAKVSPAFGNGMAESPCVGCGQCAAVCPTGAIVPTQEREDVWLKLLDPDVTSVIQIAPAVRMGVGETFGVPVGEDASGKLVAALRRMGFDKVYDTCFAADLTIIEEGNELLERLENGTELPIMTSCCPAWVNWVEQNQPDLRVNLSTCRSPQQMFGSLAKRLLPERLGVSQEKIYLVSGMPCTAKKIEARREEFAGDVDSVLTTQELVRMIRAAGIRFADLEPEAFDQPFGFATGGGVIFGASGGVMEAALRHAAWTVDGDAAPIAFEAVRGDDAIREASVTVGGAEVSVAVVTGLKAAGKVARQISRGEAPWQAVEVMACPGGCVSGAGQPMGADRTQRRERAAGLYRIDRSAPLRRSGDNHQVSQVYTEHLGAVGGSQAHTCLHTHYHDRGGRDRPELAVLGDGPVVATIVATPGSDPQEIVSFAAQQNGAVRVVAGAGLASSAHGTDE